ncbi:hypothetical protein DMH18_26755 [Streptomyces sp. WAC 06783]|uniref:hypothetical protein n=1 Tax=Streptomyces sp. WAC 06783 TaxID=2203211 RepID=UPI000F738303|nr:hypothetical protein [Streptomyces sp. WAC 06783]RSO07036.1 hypothetical protein DMH18_26755 [Streptomyces sp. WAC 06783]
MTTDIPAPPIMASPADPQDPRQAVVRALEATGAMVEPCAAGSPALEVTARLRYSALPIASVNLAPLRKEQVAEILRQALMWRGVVAHIIVLDGPDGDWRTVIRPSSAEDAARLADVVVEQLPPVYAAAHRLRTALHAAGLEQPRVTVDGSQGVRDGQWVEVPARRVVLGRIQADPARRLLALLEADTEVASGDEDQLSALPQRFLRIADFVTGVRLTVTLAACGHCGQAAELDLGDLGPDQALRLAEAVAARLPR